MKTYKNPRTATALTAVAEDIMTYSLEGLIHEAEPLFTAVYLSSSEEADRLRKTYPHVPEICKIVDDVILYHTDMNRLRKLVATGFFNFEVSWLLKLAREIPIAGARFVPMFYTALARADELGLTEDLQAELRQHIELQRQKNGYVIMHASPKDITLYFAKDVIPA